MLPNILIDINDRTYKLNLNWTIDDYLQMFYKNPELSYQDYLTDEEDFDYIINKSVGIPLSVLENCSPKDKHKIINILSSIRLFDSELKTIDLKELTFGNFVDLDIYFFNNPLKYYKDILNILSPGWLEYEMKIHDLFKVFNNFLEYRLWLYKQYKNLFDWNEKTERDDVGQLKYTNITEIAGNWFDTICSLSNDDINKIDETTNQPLIKVLNFLARKKVKILEQQQEMRKNKLHR